MSNLSSSFSQIDSNMTNATTVYASCTPSQIISGVTKSNNLKIFNVLDYSAYGDGSHDDTTAITNALAAAAGYILYFPSGTYKITSQLTPPANTLIVGVGTVVLYYSPTTNTNMFGNDTTGYSSSTVSVSGATAGAKTISVASASGIAIGDFLKVSDNTTVATFKNGEFVRIYGINSNTLTLEQPLQDTYSSTPVARKVTMLQNVTFKNIKFLGSGISYQTSGFIIYGSYGLKFDDCTFENWGIQALQLWDALKCTFRNCLFRNNFYTAQGYGLNLSNASDNVLVSNCVFESLMRHCVTTGAGSVGNALAGLPRRLLIENCSFGYTSSATSNDNTHPAEAINVHPGSRGILNVNNCEFNYSGYGVVTNNVVSAVISGCTFIGVTKPLITYGSGTTKFIGNKCINFSTIDAYASCDIIGNTFETAGEIYTDDSQDGGYCLTGQEINIMNNVFKGYTTNGIETFASISAIFNITGNTFESDGTGYFPYSTSTAKTLIRNNIIKGKIALLNCTNARIENNDLDSSSICIDLNPAAGPHYIKNNEMKSTSVGIYLRGATNPNSSVIKIRRNGIDASTAVSNISGYSAVDDDSVRI